MQKYRHSRPSDVVVPSGVVVTILALVSLFLASVAGSVAGVPSALAAAPTVPPYGEVGRFPSSPGPDVSAEYGPVTTKASSLAPGKFVDPVGMAVDTADPTAPDQYAIYVLDNTNPQALNTEGNLTSLKLEYRIQKLDDHGTVLGSRMFTLESSPTEPGLHVTSLAVSGTDGRVYVLLTDAPPVSGNTANGNAADRIDVWTTGSKGEAEGTLARPLVLGEDTLTHAGELEGAAGLQTGSAEMIGDIQGESIAVEGAGAKADLSLGGNRYTSPSSTVPFIERLSTSGANTGKRDASHPTWENKATEDAAAKAWEQESSTLYSLSGSPDGSLNVSLGPPSAGRLSADLEPNMARVGSELQSTTTLLPWEDAIEGRVLESPNVDRVATRGYLQESLFAPGTSGATPSAPTGTLGPSVAQLDGKGAFPSDIYSGVVVTGVAGEDTQDPHKAERSWHSSQHTVENEHMVVLNPASLAIRVFDAGGDSLAMIGNVLSGGFCNLQGGPPTPSGSGSYVAVAPGREGALFVLVQSDLTNTSLVEGAPLIAPHSPIGASEGDQVVEFAPGAGKECPQPLGGFSITDETHKASASTGTGPVTVETGTTLKFDASEVNLVGSSPWAYDWDLENGAKAGLVEHPWTVTNTFAAPNGSGEPWGWPTPIEEFKYETEGSYTAKLHLVNDFGTLTAERQVNVVKAAAITGASVGVSAAPTAGQAVVLSASAGFPKFDSARNYHWSFGDGSGDEDTGAQAGVQHMYAAAGEYLVKLTITDQLGHTVEASTTVVVAPASVVKIENPPGPGPVATTATTTPSVVPPPPPGTGPPTGRSTVLTRAQMLTGALKKCGKQPKKKRASCEKQAHKKYGPAKKAARHRKGKKH